MTQCHAVLRIKLADSKAESLQKEKAEVFKKRNISFFKNCTFKRREREKF